jgi:hypothetical protein
MLVESLSMSAHPHPLVTIKTLLDKPQSTQLKRVLLVTIVPWDLGHQHLLHQVARQQTPTTVVLISVNNAQQEITALLGLQL